MAETKVITKIRKKKWYPLLAPKMFRNVVLGETLVYEESAIMGKTVAENLMNLTGDFKKQNTNVEFVVTKIENNQAFTEIKGYRMTPTAIRRLTRRGSEKIELSFICDTLDGKHIRIKPLIFAISTVKSSVGHHLRKTATEFIIETIKKTTYENLINDLISFKFQSSVKAAIKKIYPVRVCQVKTMYIETGKKHGEEVASKDLKKTVKKEAPKEVKEEKTAETPKEIKTEEKEEAKEVKEQPKEEKEVSKEELTKEVKEEKTEVKAIEKTEDNNSKE
jgi:small subunit ribosomal protein S3Ae